MKHSLLLYQIFLDLARKFLENSDFFLDLCGKSGKIKKRMKHRQRLLLKLS